MAKRKSLSVDEIRETINGMIAAMPTKTNQEPIAETLKQWRDYRHGMATTLANLLHKTGNYKGFCYLDSPFVQGETDESRVHYY